MSTRLTWLIATAILLVSQVTVRANTMEVTRVLLPEAVPASELLNHPLIEEAPILAIYTAYHHDRGIFLVEDWMIAEDMLDELYRSHREFLAGTIEFLAMSLEETSEGAVPVESSLPDLEWQLDYLNATGEVLVAGVVLDMPLGVAQKKFTKLPFATRLEAGSDNLVEMPLPDYVGFSQEDSSTKTELKEARVSSPHPDSHSGRGYTPYAGSVDLTRDYAKNTLKFNDMSKFNETATYEHETIVNNRGFAKDGWYFNSDLPRWYKDCTASWPWDKVDKFVIGSMRAYDITTYRLYYTHYGLQPEDSRVTSSSAQVNGQLGYRIIPNLYWCTNINPAGPAYTCQLLRNFTAPTGFSWQRDNGTCID